MGVCVEGGEGEGHQTSVRLIDFRARECDQAHLNLRLDVAGPKAQHSQAVWNSNTMNIKYMTNLPE